MSKGDYSGFKIGKFILTTPIESVEELAAMVSNDKVIVCVQHDNQPIQFHVSNAGWVKGSPFWAVMSKIKQRHYYKATKNTYLIPYEST